MYLYSHNNSIFLEEDLEKAIDIAKKRIERGDTISGKTKEDLLSLLTEIVAFPLGRFLLINGGLNGYWTDYGLSMSEDEISRLHGIEKFLVERTFSDTRQRKEIFKKENQKSVKNGASLASIPSGLMSDLLELDYSGIRDISITAIDLDEDSLVKSKEKYGYMYSKYKVNTLKEDALNLKLINEFDLITSSGLNIFIEKDEDVIKMYTNFYDALKKNGKLVTSFLTDIEDNEVYKTEPFNAQIEEMDNAVFIDILNVKWRAVRSENKMKEILTISGFSDIKIILDECNSFPTIIAYKR